MTGHLPPQLSEFRPLGPLTSLGTGGPARWYCAVSSEEQLIAALELAEARQLPVFVLGGGSNLVVSDAGFDGLVIRIEMRGVHFDPVPATDRVLVSAAAGHPWDDLVKQSVVAGLSGLECLSGIPGTVGATPIQNVGAYGQDVAQTLARVDCFDRQTRARMSFDTAGCEFAYRDSRFKRRDPQRYVVLRVHFELRQGPPQAPHYPELKAAVAERCTSTSSPSAVRECVLALRAAKSMLLDPSDPNGRSCGSFFTNPILSAAAFEALCTRLAPDRPPSFAEADGRVKVPAAWLIQAAGFARGVRRGNVGLSSKHTLCVVAHAGATSTEVLDWARHIRATVQRYAGVALEMEPQVLADSF